MHTYSINSHERKSIPFVLAGCSIILILILKNNTNLPSWVPIPSVFAVYGILYKVFDKWIWKWPLMYNLGIVDTPNLSGVWIMRTKSSMNNYETEYEGTLYITQTWTEISIYFTGDKATSQSLMAGFDIRTSTSYALKWEYLSQKKPEFSDEDYIHYGITRVLIDSDMPGRTLKGDYFTDRSRHNYGPVTIIKKEKA